MNVYDDASTLRKQAVALRPDGTSAVGVFDEHGDELHRSKPATSRASPAIRSLRRDCGGRHGMGVSLRRDASGGWATSLKPTCDRSSAMARIIHIHGEPGNQGLPREIRRPLPYS